MSYNKEAVSAEFKRGQSLLNTGNYEKAIDVFSNLIKIVTPEIEQDKDAKLTWDTALNNRGLAKCKLAYSTGDKTMYESGMEDYRTTVNSFPEEERHWLTAYSNLLGAEKEIKDFDSMKKTNFRFFDR